LLCEGKNADVVLLGDPKQIGFVDFENSWHEVTTLKDYYHFLPSKYLLTSRRCPQDVVALPFIKRNYPGIRSTSIKGTVPGHKTRGVSIKMVPSNYQVDGLPVLCFTQAAKAALIHEHALTAHESQGSTFTSAILHLSGSPTERNLVRNSPAHLVVALTRHTNNLYVREQVPGLLNTYMNFMTNPVALDIAVDPTAVSETAFATVEEISDHTIMAEVAVPMQPVPYVAAAVTWEIAEAVVHKALPTTSAICEYQDVQKSDINYHGGGTAMVSTETVKDGEVHDTTARVVRRFPVPQRTKVTNARDSSMALKTLFERYTKKTRNLPTNELMTECRHLTHVLSHFVDLSPITEEEKQLAYGQAVERFQSRGHGVDDLVEIDHFSDQGLLLVDFTLKQQQKISMATGQDILQKDKAGQGIAAWKKTLNFTMVIWTRVLEMRLRRAKRGFIFASGQTDDELAMIFDQLTLGKKYQYLENDWSEFDSSQNNLEHELFLDCMTRLGCPLILREFFGSMMAKRVVSMKDAWVFVQDKKDSGRVDTLVGNTIFNAAVILSLVNYRELKFCAFKGDDSVLAGPTIELNNVRAAWLTKYCAYQFKMKVSHSAEFCHLVMNENGCTSNPIRIAAKVLSRMYTKPKYDEYLMAVGDLSRCWGETTTAAYACQVVSAHYRTLNKEEIDNVISFLTTFAKGAIKFEELVVFENTVKREDL